MQFKTSLSLVLLPLLAPASHAVSVSIDMIGQQTWVSSDPYFFISDFAPGERSYTQASFDTSTFTPDWSEVGGDDTHSHWFWAFSMDGTASSSSGPYSYFAPLGIASIAIERYDTYAPGIYRTNVSVSGYHFPRWPETDELYFANVPYTLDGLNYSDLSDAYPDGFIAFGVSLYGYITVENPSFDEDWVVNEFWTLLNTATGVHGTTMFAAGLHSFDDDGVYSGSQGVAIGDAAFSLAYRAAQAPSGSARVPDGGSTAALLLTSILGLAAFKYRRHASQS